MKKSAVLLLFLLILSPAEEVNSQVALNKVAQSTMNFLLVSTSPRAAALGDAYTSHVNGVDGMWYNPAGLAGMTTEFGASVHYTGWIADINYLSGGAAWNLGNYGVLGVNLLTVDYGTIIGTSLLTAAESNLYPLGYKDNGNLSNIGAYAIGISYAKEISKEFSAGGTVKYAGQSLGSSLVEAGMKDNDATKLVFDLGVRYKTSFKGFSFGMSIRNFASNIKREEIDEQLPLIFALGGSINLMEFIDEKSSDQLFLTTDFLHQNNYSERVNAGVEYLFKKMFALRAGYQSNRDLASWSGGAGFRYQLYDYNVEVDYSYSRFEVFNSVNRLSLVFYF
ncbi:MAG: PorV/PorQ family protein [Ignavibacteriaceae bacterium]|nr:PorV/PorQ family protein [Ignavibacteriaceae bacterium]